MTDCPACAAVRSTARDFVQFSNSDAKRVRQTLERSDSDSPLFGLGLDLRDEREPLGIELSICTHCLLVRPASSERLEEEKLSEGGSGRATALGELVASEGYLRGIRPELLARLHVYLNDRTMPPATSEVALTNGSRFSGIETGRAGSRYVFYCPAPDGFTFERREILASRIERIGARSPRVRVPIEISDEERHCLYLTLAARTSSHVGCINDAIVEMFCLYAKKTDSDVLAETRRCLLDALDRLEVSRWSDHFLKAEAYRRLGSFEQAQRSFALCREIVERHLSKLIAESQEHGLLPESSSTFRVLSESLEAAWRLILCDPRAPGEVARLEELHGKMQETVSRMRELASWVAFSERLRVLTNLADASDSSVDEASSDERFYFLDPVPLWWRWTALWTDT